MSDRGGIGRLARAVQLASFDGDRVPTWLRAEVAAGLGGVCLFAANVRSDAQVAAAVANLRDVRPDLVVAIDEEGGDVTRLDQPRGSELPGAAALGAADDCDATAAVYRLIGRRLAAAGIDLDLAPVADVNVAAANPVIGVRSFGDDPELVTRHVEAAVAGLRQSGIAACLKHYPGHGATIEDSHVALPVLDVDEATWRVRELAPYRATSAAAVMTAHLVVPALDDVAATRSNVLLSLLRRELGFGGVIVSDALDMAGVHGPGVRAGDVTPAMIGAAAVASLRAGCDLLCLGARQGPEVPGAVSAAIVAAVERGELDPGRLADAAARVAGMPRGGYTSGPDVAEDHRRAAGAAAAALRQRGTLPAPLTGALVVDCRPTVSVANFDVAWGLGAAMRALDPGTQTAEATPSTEPRDLLAAAAGRPLVVSVRAATAHPWQREFVASLARSRSDLVVVELGWPDDARAGSLLPGAATISTFGASRASGRAAAELLLGGR